MNQPNAPPEDHSKKASEIPHGEKCCPCGKESACSICGLLSAKRWSPYVVGILIGMLSWITFAGMGKALGTSTTLVHASGLVCGVAAPQHVQQNPYYSSELNPAKGKMMFDWQFFLVLGLFGGAAAAAGLGRDFKVERVPRLWEHRFGPGKWNRYFWAFVGGIILIYGARMAGGCTSGHGISGGLQLALSSWIFFLAMFLSGAITAFALFGMKGRQHVVES